MKQDSKAKAQQILEGLNLGQPSQPTPAPAHGPQQAQEPSRAAMEVVSSLRVPAPTVTQQAPHQAPQEAPPGSSLADVVSPVTPDERGLLRHFGEKNLNRFVLRDGMNDGRYASIGGRDFQSWKNEYNRDPDYTDIFPSDKDAPVKLPRQLDRSATPLFAYMAQEIHNSGDVEGSERLRDLRYAYNQKHGWQQGEDGLAGDEALERDIEAVGRGEVARWEEENPTLSALNYAGDAVQFLTAAGGIKAAGAAGLRAFLGKEGVERLGAGVLGRAGAAAGVGAGADLAVQGAHVAAGNQEEVDLRQAAATGIAGPIAGAVMAHVRRGLQGLARQGGAAGIAAGAASKATSPMEFGLTGQIHGPVYQGIGGDVPDGGHEESWKHGAARAVVDSLVAGVMHRAVPQSNFTKLDVDVMGPKPPATKKPPAPKKPTKAEKKAAKKKRHADRAKLSEYKPGDSITTPEGKKTQVETVGRYSIKTTSGEYIPRSHIRGSLNIGDAVDLAKKGAVAVGKGLARGAKATVSKEMARKHRATSALQEHVSTEMTLDGVTANGLTKQKYRKLIDSGEVTVTAERAKDWHTIEWKLSDGATLVSRNPDSYGRHSMIASQIGASRPKGVENRWVVNARSNDIVGRRIPAVADRGLEGLFNNHNIYRSIREWTTAYSPNPALAGMHDELKVQVSQQVEILHRNQYRIGKIKERYSEDVGKALEEALFHISESKSPFPKKIYGIAQEHHASLKKIVEENRAVIQELSKTWLDTGYITQETYDKFEGGAIYMPHTFERGNSKPSEAGKKGSDVLHRLVDDWSIRRVSGHFHARKHSIDEAYRQGLIADYSRALDVVAKQVAGSGYARLFQRIANDRAMSRPPGAKTKPEEVLATAKKREGDWRAEMAREGVIADLAPKELEARIRKDQSRARRAFLKAEAVYKADPSKENLTKLKASETRWLKTGRRGSKRSEEAFLNALVTRKRGDASKSQDMNRELASRVQDRIRAEEDMHWVQLSNSKNWGPLSTRKVDPETGKVSWEGHWVHKDVFDAIVEPLRRNDFARGISEIHKFLKRKYTAQNPGTHVVNDLSNFWLADWMGIENLSGKYEHVMRAAAQTLKGVAENGTTTLSDSTKAHLKKAGITEAEFLDITRVLLESGIYSNSQYQTEMGSSKEAVEKAVRLFQGADGKLGKAALGVNAALHQVDGVWRRAPLLGKTTNYLENRYSYVDAAHALAMFTALRTGKGSRWGAPMPEAMALLKIRDALDFSQVPRAVSDVSSVISFARIFYKLPKAVVMNLAAPSRFGRLVPGEKAAVVRALVSISSRLASLTLPQAWIHDYTRDQWFADVEDETERQRKYDAALQSHGYGAGYRSFFSFPHFWSDTPKFTDWGKYHPAAQTMMWGFEALETFGAMKEYNDAEKNLLNSWPLNKNVLVTTSSELVTGRGHYGQQSGAIKAASKSAVSMGVPGYVSRAASILSQKSTTPMQQVAGLFGIRTRDISESRMAREIKKKLAGDVDGIEYNPGKTAPWKLTGLEARIRKARGEERVELLKIRHLARRAHSWENRAKRKEKPVKNFRYLKDQMFSNGEE